MKQFTKNITKTYYDQNYFNVGAKASINLGDHGENLLIILSNGQTIPSIINRTININNRYVRFYGGIEWHQFITNNYKPKSKIVFEISNRNTIKIIPNV